jgi:outer membrane protein with beta-barrel domain
VNRWLSWNCAGLLIAASVAPAAAQSRGAGLPPPHRFEIGAFGGGAWTDSRESVITIGNTLQAVQADIDDGGLWGITADFNTKRGTQAEIFYQRQDSQLTVNGVGSIEPIDTAVEYIQAGGLGGYPRGNVRPYGSLTLGATHLSYDSPQVEDTWDFSMIFGVGAKAYLNEKLGVRFDARFPWTFTDGPDLYQFTLAGGAFALF